MSGMDSSDNLSGEETGSYAARMQLDDSLSSTAEMECCDNRTDDNAGMTRRVNKQQKNNRKGRPKSNKTESGDNTEMLDDKSMKNRQANSGNNLKDDSRLEENIGDYSSRESDADKDSLEASEKQLTGSYEPTDTNSSDCRFGVLRDPNSPVTEKLHDDTSYNEIYSKIGEASDSSKLFPPMDADNSIAVDPNFLPVAIKQELIEDEAAGGVMNNRFIYNNIPGEGGGGNNSLFTGAAISKFDKTDGVNNGLQDIKPKVTVKLKGKQLRKIDKTEGTVPLETCFNKETRMYNCPYCSYTCKYIYSLTTHVARHTGDKQFECSVCGHKAADSSNLHTHMTTHTGERPYKCTVCSYSASQSSNLRQHMKRHTGEKTHFCTLCSYSCTRATSLRRHMYTHEQELNIDQKPHACKYEDCNYSTTSTTRLQEHYSSHLGERPYKCDICDYSGVSARRLREHKLTHDSKKKPFACSLCDYTCIKITDMKRHALYHTGEKPYKCELCSYTAADPAYVKEHMFTHIEDNSYPCSQCSFTGATEAILKAHLVVHQEMKFICPECDHRCVNKIYLRRHMATHNNVRKYHCSVCQYRAKTKFQVERHMMTHTGERPEKCDLCNYSSITKAALKKHRRRMHRAEVIAEEQAMMEQKALLAQQAEQTLELGMEILSSASDLYADASLLTEASVCAEANVSSGTNLNADTSVNADTNVKAGVNINVRGDTDMHAGSDVCRDVNVGEDKIECADANAYAEANVCAAQD